MKIIQKRSENNSSMKKAKRDVLWIRSNNKLER